MSHPSKLIQDGAEVGWSRINEVPVGVYQKNLCKIGIFVGNGSQLVRVRASVYEDIKGLSAALLEELRNFSSYGVQLVGQQDCKLSIYVELLIVRQPQAE